MFRESPRLSKLWKNKSSSLWLVRPFSIWWIYDWMKCAVSRNGSSIKESHFQNIATLITFFPVSQLNSLLPFFVIYNFDLTSFNVSWAVTARILYCFVSGFAQKHLSFFIDILQDIAERHCCLILPSFSTAKSTYKNYHYCLLSSLKHQSVLVPHYFFTFTIQCWWLTCIRLSNAQVS